MWVDAKNDWVDDRPDEEAIAVQGKIDELTVQGKLDELTAKILAAEHGAIKHDAGKPPMSLLSRTALEEIAKVLEFGRKKYSAHNWRNGFQYSRVLDAAARHLYAYIDGEDIDPESGLSHMAHLGCCVMFMLELEKTHPEMDDRYKHASS